MGFTIVWWTQLLEFPFSTGLRKAQADDMEPFYFLHFCSTEQLL